MNNVSNIINNMTIKQRTDGRYEGRVTIDGKRKSFYGLTKSEVKQKTREYLQKVDNGYKDPKKIKFNDYMEYWLKEYKLNKIEPSSYTRLYRVYECQVKNTIGQKYIGDITTKDIQHLIDEHANPTDTNVKPLAYSGLQRLMHLINPCMKRAVKEHIISVNPCEDVILPKESCIKTETRIQYSLDDDEIEELRKACLEKYKNGEYRSRDALVILLILNLGLRAGEMLALRWDDIDFDKNIVFVNKTIQSNIKNFGEGKTTYNKVKKSTKTKSGVRMLRLSSVTALYLKELQEYDKRKNIVSEYVACTNVGTMNTERNLDRSLKKVVGRTNIKHNVTLHTLRHTFASTLVRRGVNIEVVSKLMGHSKISTTYNKYIHTLKEKEIETMNLISIS